MIYENTATVFETIADAIPDATALICGDTRRTWREFDDRAARLAAGLTGFGLGPDAKVAQYLYNGNEYLEAVFAAGKVRGVAVNVNYRYLEGELAYLLDNADAEAVVFHGSLGPRVAKVRGEVPTLKALIQVDDGSPLTEGAVWYDDVIAGHDPMAPIPRSGDDYVFLYTGGTTGMPKGVMWRTGVASAAAVMVGFPRIGLQPPMSLEELADRVVEAHEKGVAPVHLPAPPLMHGTGLASSSGALQIGGCVVTLPSRHFDAHEMWRAVARERVSRIAIVGDPFARPMVTALEEAEADGRAYDLSSLREVESAGAMWSARYKQGILDRAPDVNLIDTLASSEAPGLGSASGAGATASFQIGPNAKVLTEEGREVAKGSGEVGMLAVTGVLPDGYYKDEAKSAATFREFDGTRWSVPGDWARVELDGTITLLGRGSVCINTGGEKVFPEEVEEALKRHPAVVDAVVVGVPDDKWGESVTGLVSLRPGEDPTEQAVVALVGEQLAAYKRPKRVFFIDEVRRAPNGKMDYAWARDEARRLGGVGGGAAKPGTDTPFPASRPGA